MSNIFYAARRVGQKKTEEVNVNRELNSEIFSIFITVVILIFWIGGKISNWLNKY